MFKPKAIQALRRSFVRSILGRRLFWSCKERLKNWVGRRTPRDEPVLSPPPCDTGGVVQNHWDKSASEEFLRDMERRSWSGIPQVHLNHNYVTTGRRDRYWLTHIAQRYFQDGFAGDTLSLGCGEGHVDRIWKDVGLRFRSFTGIDISPASVKKAQELADAIMLSPATHYYVADLNSYRVPRQAFDFIYFFQSLHHIEALETMLSDCAAALRPGGILMVSEFVGPTRFQWSKQQVEMADRILNLLPQELRLDLLAGGNTPKTKSVTPTVEAMIQGDPSEAVRSADIDRVLNDHFDIIEEANWGGTLNYLIFENIAGNFNPKNRWHECIIELLIEHENTLIQHQVLPSDFKLYIARPKCA